MESLYIMYEVSNFKESSRQRCENAIHDEIEKLVPLYLIMTSQASNFFCRLHNALDTPSSKRSREIVLKMSFKFQGGRGGALRI